MNSITVQSLEDYLFESKSDLFHIILITNDKHYYYTNPGFTELDNEEGFVDTMVFDRGSMGGIYYKALKEAGDSSLLSAGHLSPLEVLSWK